MDTCAAVESQLSGGVKFLDEELGQRYSFVRVQGFVALLPVQHQVVICVRIWRGEEGEVSISVTNQIRTDLVSHLLGFNVNKMCEDLK